MPKRVMYVCHFCGGYVYNGEKSKVTTTKDGIQHYHYDHGLDCLADEKRALRIAREMDERGEM